MKQPPFKVVCVLVPEIWKMISEIHGKTYPQVLDECTVTEVSTTDATYYTLAEHGDGSEFDARCFAILPDTSGEVAAEHDQEAIIYQR